MRTKTQASYKVVFTADQSWWDVRGNEIELNHDSYDREAIDFVFPAGHQYAYLNDCDEAFAAEVTAVDPEHTAIKVGDICVSHGYGDDKIFVRKI